MRESEVPGAQAMYLPEWQLGRRRGMPRRPKQLCMQADGATLIQRLQAAQGAKQASCTRVHELGKASELRGSAEWATVTALHWSITGTVNMPFNIKVPLMCVTRPVTRYGRINSPCVCVRCL